MATKTLPSHNVQISAKIGDAYSSYSTADKTNIAWEIIARKDGAYISESDEYFSVALAKVVAETTRATSKPVEDVEVEDEEVISNTEVEEDSSAGF